MAIKVLVLGTVEAALLDALRRSGGDVEIVPPAEAHAILGRIAADPPQLLVAGAGAFDWAGSASLLHQVLDSEFTRAVRYRHPLSVVLVGIDRLADLTATHGTDALETWRASFAEALRRSLRRIDVLARTGEDEIAVLLPETSAAGARAVASRAVAIASRLIVKGEAGADRKALPVKASVRVGIADAPRDGVASAEGFLAAARAALGRARERNGEGVVSA